MRYKVKAHDAAAYRHILGVLQGRVPIYVASEKRHMLSVGSLPDDCREAILARGGEVVPDFQYDLERP